MTAWPGSEPASAPLVKRAAVSRQTDEWPKKELQAFLINTCNAWTVKLIRSPWPAIASISRRAEAYTSDALEVQL